MALDQEPNILVRWRFSLIPVISFYNNSEDYTINTRSLIGFGAGAKAELSLKSSKTSKVITGLEYFNQGMAFDSYYFAPGHSVKYDKHFDYHHSLRFQELQLPLLFKQCFNNEDDKFYSVYLTFGWACRYVFLANSTIANAQTGVAAWKGSSDMEFEHFLGYKKLGAILLAGAGFEKKLGDFNRAIFFEFSYNYNIFRLHYAGDGLSNNIFFKNNQLTIGLGYKF